MWHNLILVFCLGACTISGEPVFEIGYDFECQTEMVCDGVKTVDTSEQCFFTDDDRDDWIADSLVECGLAVRASCQVRGQCYSICGPTSQVPVCGVL